MDTPQAEAAGPVAECQVSEAEAGQKLLQFLQRRLQLPQSLLHRWLRTGQVRLNGGRCKPFARVAAGDMVRLPPFALKLAAQARTEATPRRAAPARAALPALSPLLSPQLSPLPHNDTGILAFCKPAGLPVHGGTGHSTSLASLLAAHHAHADFCPTPVHRLDKDTSGVLLVAASYAALRDAQEALRNGLWHKEYLAWVQGRWPWTGDRLLQHILHKATKNGFEKMRILPAEQGHAPASQSDSSDSTEGHGKMARCLVRCLVAGQRASLVQVRLLTGRTHQIRAQLAHMGHPVLGDAKYGGQSSHAARAAGTAGLLLHSMRICLPDGQCFTALPDWPEPFSLAELPTPLDEAAGAALPCPQQAQ